MSHGAAAVRRQEGDSTPMRTPVALARIAWIVFAAAGLDRLPRRAEPPPRPGANWCSSATGKPWRPSSPPPSRARTPASARPSSRSTSRRSPARSSPSPPTRRPPAGTLILVGRSSLTDRIPGLEIPTGKTKNLREEGFVIQTDTDRLVLAGNDIEPYYGTRYAVAEFLHRLGVRWFMPGEIGEVVPKMATVSVGPMRVAAAAGLPAAELLGARPRQHGRRVRGVEDPQQDEPPGHRRRLRRAGRQLGAAASCPRTSSRPTPTGSPCSATARARIGHPCTTSEGMIQHFVELHQGRCPRRQRASRRSPRTTACPAAGATAARRSATLSTATAPTTATRCRTRPSSNEWFYFVNRILTEVNKEFPDHIISTNGYANRDVPPEMPPDVAFNPNEQPHGDVREHLRLHHPRLRRSEVLADAAAGPDDPAVVQALGQGVDVQLQLHHARQQGHASRRWSIASAGTSRC